jgi:hypothetical protein
MRLPQTVDIERISGQTLTARDWSKDLRYLSSYFAPDRIYQLYHDSAVPHEEGLFVKMIYLMLYNSSTSDILLLLYGFNYPFYSRYFEFPVKAGFYGIIPIEFAFSYPISDYSRGIGIYTPSSGLKVSLCLNIYHEKYKIKSFNRLVGGSVCGFTRFDIATYDGYNTSAGSGVVVAKWDYGSVVNIRKFYNKIKYYISAANANSFVSIDYSTDDATYYNIWNTSNLPTSETETDVVKENFQARYIRFMLSSGSTSQTAYLKIYPNLTWVPR